MEITMILMNMMNKLGRSSDTAPNMYSISMSNISNKNKKWWNYLPLNFSFTLPMHWLKIFQMTIM